MSDFGFFGGYGAYTSLGLATATTGATANTKGAWSQVIAATTADIKSLILSLRPGAGNAALWDVGVGAAGSEVPVITNLAAYSVDTLNDYYGPVIYFPVAIPAGSRVAIRAQGSLASTATSMNITASEAPFSSLALNGVHTDYGTVLASSLGTAVNVPASGTGAYAQLVAATTNPIKLLTIYVTGTSGGTEGAFDLAVGAAGAEQIIMPSQRFLLRNTETGCGPSVMQIPCDIPAGMRISARTTFFGGVGATIYISLDGAY